MHIRPLTLADSPQWQSLWQQYLDFYHHQLAPDVTASVFAQLCEGQQMVGLVAENTAGTLVGFIHLVFHPSTWSQNGYCYIEDVLVAPEARRQGVGEALFDAAGQLSEQRQCDRTYWVTRQDNTTAQHLYDRIGKRVPFILYNR